MGSQAVSKAKAHFLEEEQLGKLVEEKDQQEEQAVERRRNYTDLGEKERHTCRLPCLNLGFV